MRMSPGEQYGRGPLFELRAWNWMMVVFGGDPGAALSIA